MFKKKNTNTITEMQAATDLLSLLVNVMKDTNTTHVDLNLRSFAAGKFYTGVVDNFGYAEQRREAYNALRVALHNGAVAVTLTDMYGDSVYLHRTVVGDERARIVCMHAKIISKKIKYLRKSSPRTYSPSNYADTAVRELVKL